VARRQAICRRVLVVQVARRFIFFIRFQANELHVHYWRGKETDGIEGIAGIVSRADFVMLSIRLGADSSASAELMPPISVTKINKVFSSLVCLCRCIRLS
jgi:hypothetical protein